MSVEAKPVIEAKVNEGIRVDASVVAKPFRQEIKTKVAALKKQGIGEWV